MDSDFTVGFKQGQAHGKQIILEKVKDAITQIENVKSVMNEEIIEHNRKDLINFINGINQCLCILERHLREELNEQ